MILQSLYRYYQILLKDDSIEIAPPGYCAANVSFALNLSSTGDLLEILPFTSKLLVKGKERERNYRRLVVPERIKRSGTKPLPNFLCDNAGFVLGISEKGIKYDRIRFEAFRKHNSGLLSKAKSKAARAIVVFLENHDPNTARRHPVIARSLDGLMEGGNLIFWVEGKDTLQDAEICRVWEEYISGKEAVRMQCLVTGEIEPIARLHPSIQGVRDANPTGASLVSFNERAYESYGRTKGQGLNSPVSQAVASGYGVALNYLLSDQNSNRKIHLGDTTVAYWAESENKRYGSAFAALLNPEYAEESAPDDQRGRKEAENKMREVAGKIEKGQPLDIASLRQGLDDSTRFYVLGLAPSAARLAVRFFLTEPFGRFVERIMLHYQDLKIEKEFPNQPDYISPYRILAECVSPKVVRRNEELKESWSLLGGALMRSILTGSSYPEGLYAAIINRIRHDSDEEGKSRKINYVRAAFIKAHLLRKYRCQAQNPYQEALQMSLNESYAHPAYVLGRLFAVLEKVQQEAIGDVNASIKDRYFTSACASPASVFPILLRLSQHHISKAEYGYVRDHRIEAILNLLDVEKNPIPSHLSLDEEGVFVLGYYHERKDLWTSKDKKPAELPPSQVQ